MTEYTYGAPVEHTGRICPVPMNTQLRVILRRLNGWMGVLPASEFDWGDDHNPVLVYQVATPVSAIIAAEKEAGK